MQTFKKQQVYFGMPYRTHYIGNRMNYANANGNMDYTFASGSMSYLNGSGSVRVLGNSNMAGFSNADGTNAW